MTVQITMIAHAIVIIVWIPKLAEQLSQLRGFHADAPHRCEIMSKGLANLVPAQPGDESWTEDGEREMLDK